MHALITGASSGIGEAIARALGAEGYDLTLVARRQGELDRVASTTPGVRAEKVVADLAEPAVIDAICGRATAALGPVDVLINNAGAQIVAPTEEVDTDDGERLLRLNVFAPFRLTRALLPSMLARRTGTIVDVTSMSALAPPPGMYHYGASKAALAAASESLRAEVKNRGVHVITVYPGPIKTAMSDAAIARYAKDPSGPLPAGSADQLARLVVRAIKRKQPRVIYPRSYALVRLLPALSRWTVDTFGQLPTSTKR